jgi:hypothetical protein
MKTLQQELEVLMMVAKSSARLQMIRAEILMLTWFPGLSTTGLGSLYAGNVGALTIIGETANMDALRRSTRTQK